jgi:hypothetical protein
MGGIMGAGDDNSHAREKFVDAVGNLNKAVLQLQQVVGLSTDVTGLLQLVNGNLSFGNFSAGQDSGNLQTELIGGTSPVLPNTAQTISHTLGKIPNGFIAGQTSAACNFYGTAAGNAWTNTTLTILCDTASVNFVLLVY